MLLRKITQASISVLRNHATLYKGHVSCHSCRNDPVRLFSRYLRGYTSWSITPLRKTIFHNESLLLSAARLCSTTLESSASFIRVIDESGTNLGLMEKNKGLEIASNKGMELLQVKKRDDKVPNSVYKIVGKKSETVKIETLSVETKPSKMREITMRSQIEEKDLEFKVKKVRQFLLKGSKVTLKIAKPGRASTTPKEAFDKLMLLLSDMDVKVDGSPKQSDHYFRCVLKPGDK